MKKILLLTVLIPAFCFAQDSLVVVKHGVDTLYSATGFKVYKGMKLKTGTGTMPDGDFKFIKIAESSFFHRSSISGGSARVNEENALPMKYSSLELPVIRIDKKGDAKQGFSYYPVIDNITRYQVDLDKAIASGEIIVPEQYMPKQKPMLVEIKQNTSVADELIKLKKLKDDGIISEDEFQVQKKKLLDK